MTPLHLLGLLLIIPLVACVFAVVRRRLTRPAVQYDPLYASAQDDFEDGDDDDLEASPASKDADDDLLDFSQPPSGGKPRMARALQSRGFRRPGEPQPQPQPQP